MYHETICHQHYWSLPSKIDCSFSNLGRLLGVSVASL
jgi:hypothetical protein